MVRELDKTIAWEIEKKSLFTIEDTLPKEVPGYNAIIRNDNGGVLSVMKKSYSPMFNAEFLEIVERIKEISGFELAGFNEFKAGAKVLGFLENNRGDISIGGHKMKSYMLLGNSFDGTTSFFQGTSTTLIRCQNQFSQIQVQNKLRHTKSLGRKLEEFYAYLDFFLNQQGNLIKKFEMMGNITLTEELKEKMIKFVLGVDEISDKELSARKQNQIELLRNTILQETKDLGENMWGAFNGVTKYTTHSLVSKAPTFGNVFGMQATINDKAMSFSMEQVGERAAELLSAQGRS